MPAVVYTLQQGADLVKQMNGIFCFKVKSDGKEGTWVVDLKNGTGSVKFDPAGKRFPSVAMS